MGLAFAAAEDTCSPVMALGSAASVRPGPVCGPLAPLSPGITGRPGHPPWCPNLSESQGPEPSPEGHFRMFGLPPASRTGRLICIKQEASGIQDTLQEVRSCATAVLFATIRNSLDETCPRRSSHGLGHSRSRLRPSSTVEPGTPSGKVGGWRLEGCAQPLALLHGRPASRPEKVPPDALTPASQPSAFLCFPAQGSVPTLPGSFGLAWMTRTQRMLCLGWVR